MAFDINFYAGTDFLITPPSGLGFFGDAGFGASIAVGSWNGRTYICSSDGATQSAEVDNIKYHSLGSGIIGQTGSGVAINHIPNYLATVEIRATNDTAIQITNAKVRTYDRSDANLPQSGVTCKIASLQHPSISQLVQGSGDSTWTTTGGSGSILSLCDSPGVSGLYANNSSTRTDTSHSWFLAITASPDSIGSKTQFDLYCSMEYN